MTMIMNDDYEDYHDIYGDGDHLVLKEEALIRRKRLLKICQKWVTLSFTLSSTVLMSQVIHEHVGSRDDDAKPKEACEQKQKVLVQGVGGGLGKEAEEDDDGDGEEKSAPALNV